MSGDKGVAAIAMAAMAALLATVSAGVVSVGVVLAARSQAVAGADGAALAAAVATYPAAAATYPVGAIRSPAEIAAAVARANGTTLVSCVCPVDMSFKRRVVTVVVAVPVDAPILGRLTIHVGARAEFDPRIWLGR